MPMFPLGTVLFPHALLPLHVFEPRYRLMTATRARRRRRVRCRAHRTRQRSRRRRHAVRRRHGRARRAARRSSPTAATRSRRSGSGGSASRAGSPTIRTRAPRSSTLDDRARADAGDADGRVARRACARARRRVRARTGGSIRASPTLPARRRRSRRRRRTRWRRSRRSVRSTRSGCSETVASGDRLALLADLLDEHARDLRAAASTSRSGGADRGAVGYARRMTQHFDEEAARRRLEAEQERVEGLIASRSSGEGLDDEAADQVGDVAHVDASGRPGVGDVRTREGPRDPRTARERSRRDRSRVAAARRRHATASTRSPASRSTPERLEAYSDRAHERRHPRIVTVTLRLFAAAREAAGRGQRRLRPSPTAPTVGALLDAAAAAVRRRRSPRCSATSRVWVNGDEPAGGRGDHARRRRRGRRAAAGQRRDSLSAAILGRGLHCTVG